MKIYNQLDFITNNNVRGFKMVIHIKKGKKKKQKTNVKKQSNQSLQ